MFTITPALGRITGTALVTALAIGVFTPQGATLPQQTLATINLQGYDTFVTPAPLTADDYYHRGLFFQGQGDLDGALEQFNQAIALEPENPDLYFSRGLTQSDLGDQQQAIADYSKAIEFDGTFSAAYYQRAMARIAVPIAGVTSFTQPTIAVDQREPLELAIQDFSTAIEYLPDFVAAHYYRGLSNYVIGNESLAWEDYQRARNLNPQIANGFYRQGFTQLYIGGPTSPL